MIEFNTSSLSVLKDLRCSSRSFVDFSNSNNLTFNPNQILYFDQLYLFFDRELFYLYDAEQLGLYEFRPRGKHEPVGPVPVRLLDVDFPLYSTGIVRLLDEVWVFKADQIWKMNEQTLRSKLNEHVRFLSAKKGLGAVCRHQKFQSISLSIIRIIYDIHEKPFGLKSVNESSALTRVSTLEEFGCSSSGEICILENSGLFYYLSYHLGWLCFLLVLILLLWPLSVLLAYLWMKHKDDFYIVDETRHKVRLASNQKIPSLSRQDEMRKRMYPHHLSTTQPKSDDSEEDEETPINLPIEKSRFWVTERIGKLIDGFRKSDNPPKGKSSFYSRNQFDQQAVAGQEESSTKPKEEDRPKYSERNIE